MRSSMGSCRSRMRPRPNGCSKRGRTSASWSSRRSGRGLAMMSSSKWTSRQLSKHIVDMMNNHVESSGQPYSTLIVDGNTHKFHDTGCYCWPLQPASNLSSPDIYTRLWRLEEIRRLLARESAFAYMSSIRLWGEYGL